MNYDFIKNFLRRRLRHPAVYALGRRLLLLSQWALRKPDEPDFVAFKAIANEDGVAVDIGANGGQSAIAFSFLLPKFRIVSFEPNAALWRDLGFIKHIIGRRFSLHKVGLGPAENKMTLFVPQIGNLPVTTRASLDCAAAQAHCDRLEKEIGQRPIIANVTVDVAPFDDFELRPDIIKIDVEGYELPVLQGMIETLREALPILLIESNANDKACMDLLAPLGYRFRYFNLEARRLSESTENRSRNWFAIPPQRDSELRLIPHPEV